MRANGGPIPEFGHSACKHSNKGALQPNFRMARKGDSPKNCQILDTLFPASAKNETVPAFNLEG